jgi:pyruvate-formate lyase
MKTNLNAHFEVELGFTETYRKYRDAHPAIREAECLAAMFPAALSPIEQGDLLAGRFTCGTGTDKFRGQWDPRTDNIPAIGFAGLVGGGPNGAGYFFDPAVMKKKIDVLQPESALREKLADIASFWETETCAAKVRAAYPDRMKEALPYDDWVHVAHPAHPLYRIAGPHFDFDKLVRLGIPGLRAEATAGLQRARAGKGEPELFEGMLKALDVLSGVCRFYADQAAGLRSRTVSDARGQELLDLGKVLRALPEQAPQTFYEATQLALLYAVVSNAYCFGRMDIYLGSFLVSDIENGTLTEERALRLTQSMWRIINDNGAPFDNRIIIGGKGRPNEAHADRFAQIAIEATRTVLKPLPQLTLRFYKGQNPLLYDLAMQSIGEGRTHPMLYNDEVNIPSAAKAMNVPAEVAVDYLPYGCGEYVLYKKSIATPSSVMNVLKVLETVLRNGREAVNGKTVGVPLGLLRDFKTFDELLAAFKTNLRYWIEILADQEKLEYDVVGRECRYLFWSMVFDDCMARGKGVLNGGLYHLSGTLESYGQINAADALLAIKQLVYDEKKIAPDKLVAAMDADFDGFDEIRQMLLSVPKYGNDDPQADAMSQEIHDFICETTRAQARRVGLDSYLIVVINNSANVILGRQTLASADGRKAFTYMANGNNPQSGMDRNGITAFLNSISKLRTDHHAGAVQNMKFSKEFFTPRMRPKLDTLLNTYWANGGAQAMITVVSRGDLEAALREPEKYAGLIVRVGGWSARFVELEPDVQQEILSRTLNE